MKQLFTFLTIVLAYINCVGQTLNFDQIKKKCYHVSTDSLVSVYENLYKKDRDSIFKELNYSYEPFNFRKYKPLLVVETYLAEEISGYNSSDDLTKYFRLSPNAYHLAYLENNKVVAFVRYSKDSDFEGVVVYETNDDYCWFSRIEYDDYKYLKKLFKNINNALKDKPDFIFTDKSLNLLLKKTVIITTKNSNMFIYDKRKKPFELNYYFKKHFKNEEIRRLSKYSNVFENPDYIIMD